MAKRNGDDLGDGDRCPVDPEHGKMSAIQGSDKQHCNHQSHDGRPKTHPLGESEPTRAFWPLGDNAFAEAVAAWKETHHG